MSIDAILTSLVLLGQLLFGHSNQAANDVPANATAFTSSKISAVTAKIDAQLFCNLEFQVLKCLRANLNVIRQPASLPVLYLPSVAIIKQVDYGKFANGKSDIICLKEWMNLSKQNLCIDFDSTLCQYESWEKNGNTPGEPIKDAREACIELSKDFRLVILTTRDDHDVVRRWLKWHNFPEMEVTSYKVGAVAYIDDRGFRFEGNWQLMVAMIKAGTTPWWKRIKDNEE